MDLVHEGILSLYRARSNYDESYGLSFISYAHMYILDSMNRYLKRNLVLDYEDIDDIVEELEDDDYDAGLLIDIVGMMDSEDNREILIGKLLGKSNKEIGNGIGYSGEWVRKRLLGIYGRLCL